MASNLIMNLTMCCEIISTALFSSLCFFIKLLLHTMTAALPSAVAAVMPKVIGGQKGQPWMKLFSCPSPSVLETMFLKFSFLRLRYVNLGSCHIAVKLNCTLKISESSSIPRIFMTSTWMMIIALSVFSDSARGEICSCDICSYFYPSYSFLFLWI